MQLAFNAWQYKVTSLSVAILQGEECLRFDLASRVSPKLHSWSWTLGASLPNLGSESMVYELK